ncbi:MAG: metal-dependent transcriptional regulator [Candidatus Tectomicrobia bacterium]|uniref:Transcriptional regulator MntR n=1 Tax=Tectimicrobiota bacterium TaxID=2528274 RepID=A0A932ML62_UNCTE|nr:metal-dependent transcriptional regulator [Candidatus Tectomicrobia bacterium]
MVERLSKHVEDYLKNIYKLQAESAPVSTKSIAERMNLSPASVTSMTQKLHQMELLDYTPYKGVTLTARGEKVALEIIRHHRLLELYLNQKMGMEWHKVDAEAEELEHVLSEELEAAMDHALDYPTLDPHGDPIPAKDGTMVSAEEEVLTDIPPGRATRVTRVLQDDAEVLRRLGQLGFYPEAALEVRRQDPLAGTVTVILGGKSVTIGREIALRIFAAK